MAVEKSAESQLNRGKKESVGERSARSVSGAQHAARSEEKKAKEVLALEKKRFKCSIGYNRRRD